MRKIFTLLSALAVGALFASAEEVTITYSLAETGDAGTVTGLTADGTVTSAAYTAGTKLDNHRKKDYGADSSIKGVEWRLAANTENTTDNWIKFPITVAEGYTFTPTSITFMDGVSHDKIVADFMIVDANNTTTTLATGVTLPRYDKNDKVLRNASYTTGLPEKLAGTFNFVADPYFSGGSASNKYYAMSTLVIKGNLEAADARGEAPISWSVENTELTVGDAFTAPTIVNAENLALTFSSDNEALATVDANGVISLVPDAFGTAVISAKFTADAESTYKDTEVKTTIKVNGLQKDLTLAWSATEYTYTVNGENGVAPTIVIPDGCDLTVADLTYTVESSNTKGHQVSVENGVLTVGEHPSLGSFTIKASFEANDSWKAAEASFALTVAANPVAAQDDVLAEYSSNGDTFFNVHPNGTASIGNGIKESKVLLLNNSGANNGIRILTAEGFKKGDVIDVTAYSSHDSKKPLTDIYANGTKVLDGKELVNKPAELADVTPLSFTLEADAQYLDLVRGGEGTTVYILGVKVTRPAAAPEAPVMKDENGNELSEINLDNTEGVTVKFEAADGHNVYYLFSPNAPAVTPEAAPAKEGAATLEHQGETYALAPAEGVKITEAGTLKYFAHNPDTDARSEVKSATATGTTTGIADINADVNAPVEYFNLQGIRVANPENGMFIRRQGNQVTKVIM